MSLSSLNAENSEDAYKEEEAPAGYSFSSNETLAAAPMAVEELNARLDALEPVLDEADTKLLAKLLDQKQALMDEVDEVEANARLTLEPVAPYETSAEQIKRHNRNICILMDNIPLQKYEDWLEGLPRKERSLLESPWNRRALFQSLRMIVDVNTITFFLVAELCGAIYLESRSGFTGDAGYRNSIAGQAHTRTRSEGFKVVPYLEENIVSLHSALSFSETLLRIVSDSTAVVIVPATTFTVVGSSR